MAAGKRYKFQGSQLLVGTSFAAHKEIVSISLTNPVVVGVASHGYSEGDVIKASRITGTTKLNGNLYVVEDPAASTFELANVDGTGYTAFDTGSPQDGRVEKVNFVNFCELTGINKQGGTSEEIEATTICSNAKEYETGMPDSGSLQLDFNFAPNQAVQAYLRAAQQEPDPDSGLVGRDVAFKVVLPGDGGSIIVIGKVQQTNWQAAVNGLWTGSVTVKLSGEEFVLPAA